jgi:hypothetical protein
MHLDRTPYLVDHTESYASTPSSGSSTWSVKIHDVRKFGLRAREERLMRNRGSGGSRTRQRTKSRMNNAHDHELLARLHIAAEVMLQNLRRTRLTQNSSSQ